MMRREEQENKTNEKTRKREVKTESIKKNELLSPPPLYAVTTSK